MSGKALSGKRIKREKIDEILKKLFLDYDFLSVAEKHDVCGSYRRGKKDSGDIDIVFIPNNRYKQWFENLVIPKRIGKLSNNILIDDVQIDLFEATNESYANMVMTWTGSRGFNMMMRGKSIKAGYIYTRYGMYDAKTKEIITGIETENDIFNLIGIEYIPPERR